MAQVERGQKQTNVGTNLPTGTARTKEKGSGQIGSEPAKEIVIDLYTEARLVWAQKFGAKLPVIQYEEIGGRGWTPKFAGTENLIDEGILTFPPCAEFDNAVPLQERRDGSPPAFRKKKDAKRAMYWSIIINVPDKGAVAEWARGLMGPLDNHGKIYTENHKQRVFCHLKKQGPRGLYIEHNSRQHWIQDN
jgi:hypothetical protein